MLNMYNMSVLVSSQDIYLSTQQSGSPAGAGSDDGFNRFKMCLNTAPLTTADNEMARLLLTQFSAYRNFYYVNDFNNRVDLTYDHGGSSYAAVINLTKQDYANIGDIAAEFSAKLIAIFAGVATFTIKAGTQQPVAGYTKGSSGTGIFGVTLETSGAAHGITNVKLQTRQYVASGIPAMFGDSYALLGGKRVGAADATAESFTAANGAADELVITGFYPMQRTTTQYLYMHVSENTTNLQSQNYSAAQNVPDTHIVSSNIIAKIPINNEIIGFQQDTSSPFFVELDNRHISEMLFEMKDHHGRTIDQLADISKEGNLFSDMVLTYEVYAKGANDHELRAPIKNFYYETNTAAVNTRANTGSGF